MKCDRCQNEATVHEVIVKGGQRHERHLCEACARSEGMAGQSHIPLTQLLNQFITSHMSPAPGQATPSIARQASAGVCPSCGTTLGQFRQNGLLGCPECYATFEGQLAPLLQKAHEGGTHHHGKRPLRARNPAGLPPASGSPAPLSSPGAGGPSAAPGAPGPADAVGPASPRSRAKPPAPRPEPGGAVAGAGSSSSPPDAPEARPAEGAAALAARVMDLRARLNEAVAREKYEDAARIRDELIRLERSGSGKAAAKRAARTRGEPGVGGSPEGAA